MTTISWRWGCVAGISWCRIALGEGGTEAMRGAGRREAGRSAESRSRLSRGSRKNLLLRCAALRARRPMFPDHQPFHSPFPNNRSQDRTRHTGMLREEHCNHDAFPGQSLTIGKKTLLYICVSSCSGTLQPYMGVLDRKSV